MDNSKVRGPFGGDPVLGVVLPGGGGSKQRNGCLIKRGDRGYIGRFHKTYWVSYVRTFYEYLNAL